MDAEKLQRFEPLAKTLAATSMAQSLSFCMERKYLEGIDGEGLPTPFKMKALAPVSDSAIRWIAISQVGKPLEDSAESCFTAIQKILYSCFLPKKVQLVFMVTGRNGVNSMYVGLRCPGQLTPSKSMVKSLCDYMKGIWPGLDASVLKEPSEAITHVMENAGKEEYENVIALTGIPSMETQYKSLYPATLDKLMAGMRGAKNYAYIVIADPIETQDAEGMLYNCREMNGQAESLKSMNITEGLNFSTTSTDSVSRSISDAISHAESISESKTKVDLPKAGKIALGVAGFGLAGAIFPASAAVLDASANASVAVLQSVAGLAFGSVVGSAVGNLIPKKTITKGSTDTTSHTTTEGQSHSEGVTEGKSQSMSRNLVNKHIEAISEHLFYHSRRYETGKAIGLWKVGVYLLGQKASELQSGALQLRSTLSGQESIYEPIRLHNISSVMDEEIGGKNIRALSFGELLPPVISVQSEVGVSFKHPLGHHFNDLRTVLTTKELSYLINFPLHSVPGISVVDSCPDFCLNAQAESNGIGFGKLVNGGTETKISYNINPKVLSRHALVCGINGSGKTNTIQAILNGIKDNIPYLVIEPAKTEYVDWAIEHNRLHPENPVAIYIPGCKKYRGGFVPEELHINPFDIIWLREDQEPNVLAHIDRLKSTFAAAFPMYDILPVLLEDLIYSVYQNKSTDWLNAAPEFGKTKPPTLNSMRVNVEKVIGAHQYEERIGRNMMACLNTRIDSLRRGWKGEMLCCAHSTTDKLFKRPVVVNLSYVGDDTDKAFIMALILQRLYEYRQAEAEIGAIDFNDSCCRHLTIIEEAHRVMAKCDNVELPQYKSATMFSNMLSEIRAYGEGFMLVDQVPTRLIPDAIKNTNLKICHRMVAEDDCKAIGESMSLTKEQRRLIPKLLTGQCIVSSSYETESYWVKADKVK